MARTTQAAALFAAGIVLALGAFIVRAQAYSDWEYDSQVDLLVSGTSDPFNNAPYIAAWAVSGLLVLGGFIIYGTARPD